MLRWGLCIGVLLGSISLWAQKPFEGRIHYSVEYLSFPEGMEGAELSLPQQMTLVIKGVNYRMQQASALGGELVWIRPAAVDSLYQLFDFMDQKVFLAMEMKPSAARYRIVPKEGSAMIAGASCTRLLMQSASGEHREAWVWEKFMNPLTHDFPSLKFLPLQYELVKNGIHMRLTAKRIVEEPVDETYFVLPTNAVRIDEGILQRIMN